MLTLLPVAPALEPDFIQQARIALEEAPDFPDHDLLMEVIDVTADAVARVQQIVPHICDARAREAVECPRHGVMGVMADVVSDIAYAAKCWADRPENSPSALRDAARADAHRLAAE